MRPNVVDVLQHRDAQLARDDSGNELLSRVSKDCSSLVASDRTQGIEEKMLSEIRDVAN